jgi:hypothetical protein
MNILDALNDAYATSALRLCFKFYSSSIARGIGTSPVKTSYATLTWNTLSGGSLMAGHIRSQTQKAGGTQVVEVTAVPSTYSVLYCDTYISTTSGTRLLNLGTNVASGYTDITFEENEQPYIEAGGFITPPPTDYTSAFPKVHTSNGNCDDTAKINQTFGGSSFSFYVGLMGVYGIYTRAQRGYTCVVTLTYDGTPQTIFTGSIYENVKIQVTGTLAGSKTWAYNKVGVVTVTVGTWGSQYETC